MILAVDVGNTNIVLGVLDGENLVCSGRFYTDMNETDEEYAMKLASFMRLHNEVEDIDGAIISSVVPVLTRTMKSAIRLVTGVNAMVVGPGIKTGLNILSDNPSELGADMVVTSVAAKSKYSCPQIIFDFGTATTASVIDKNGSFIGCVIFCGVKTAINAMYSGTAQLPQIDIMPPEHLIGTNTVDCMKSGAVYGTAAMIDGMVAKIEKELGEKATVVITGGLGKTIARECETDAIVDKNLLIDGLRIIYERNKK